jgi:hypothetical protein
VHSQTGNIMIHSPKLTALQTSVQIPKEQQERQLLVEIIDGTSYTPDINNSDLMFKNFSAGNESVQPEVRNFYVK